MIKAGDQNLGWWGSGGGVRSRWGISPTAAGSRKQTSRNEVPWESVELEQIRN
jgi:hypothetical protein